MSTCQVPGQRGGVIARGRAKLQRRAAPAAPSRHLDHGDRRPAAVPLACDNRKISVPYPRKKNNNSSSRKIFRAPRLRCGLMSDQPPPRALPSAANVMIIDPRTRDGPGPWPGVRRGSWAFIRRGKLVGGDGIAGCPVGTRQPIMGCSSSGRWTRIPHHKVPARWRKDTYVQVAGAESRRRTNEHGG